MGVGHDLFPGLSKGKAGGTSCEREGGNGEPVAELIGSRYYSLILEGS